MNVQSSPLLTLERLHMALPSGRVSIGWLERALDKQASYLLILVFALLGALPAASLPAGLAICALSLSLFVTRASQLLPASIAARQVGSPAVRYAIGHAIAVLRFAERLFPVSRSDMARVRPLAGILLFVLGALMMVPIPLSNVLPALSAAVLVLALIEGSTAMLVAGTLGGFISIMLVAAATTAAVHAII